MCFSLLEQVYKDPGSAIFNVHIHPNIFVDQNGLPSLSFFVFVCFYPRFLSLISWLSLVRCADDKPFFPKYQVSKEKALTLGIEFTPLEVSLKETIDSLKEKNFINF